MYSVQTATKEILDNFTSHKATYGPVNGLPFGAGMICEDIRYPLCNKDNRKFMTVEGTVLILTHECDLSPENDKIQNEDILICPIIPFENFFDAYKNVFEVNKLRAFIMNLSNNKIFRAMYLPPHDCSDLQYGGIVFFNKICSTHTDLISFEDNVVCSLSAIGYDKLGRMLHNHLLRPKSAELPLSKFVSANFKAND